MFVFLSKFLPTFVYPLGLIFLLIFLALILRRYAAPANHAAGPHPADPTHRQQPLGVFCTGPLTGMALPAARPRPAGRSDRRPGWGTESGQYPTPGVEVNSAGDRVLYAARLYKEGKAPHILLSGGNIAWLNGRTMTPAAEMAESSS